MLYDLVIGLISIGFIIGFVLLIGNYRGFEWYSSVIAGIIDKVLLRFVKGVFIILRIATVAALRWVKKILIILPVWVIYILSFPVPLLGRINLNQKVTRSISRFYVRDHIETARGVIVSAFSDLIETEENREEEFREELRQLRTQAESRLQQGEVLLSLLFGGALLIAQVINPSKALWQSEGFPISSAVQVYALLVVMSVLYRSAFLDMMAYEGSEEFDSVTELDAATTFQKGLLNVPIIPMLLLAMPIILDPEDRRFDIVATVFHEYINESLSVPELVGRTWELHRDS